MVGYDRDRSIWNAGIEEPPEPDPWRDAPADGADVEAEEGLLAESLAPTDVGLADPNVVFCFAASLVAMVRFLASALDFAACERMARLASLSIPD